MLHQIKCDICGITNKVNGQKGISNFVIEHRHNQSDLQLKTNPKVTLPNG